VLARTSAWRLRSVVRPYELLSRAYSSLPDTDERCFKQTHNSSQHFFTGKPETGQIARDAQPDFRQCTPESDQSIVLGLITNSSPVGMIPILFSATCVSSASLEMTGGIGTYPDITPCRRDRQAPYSIKGVEVANRLAGAVKVAKRAVLLRSANDAWAGIGHVMKASRAGCDRRLRRKLQISMEWPVRHRLVLAAAIPTTRSVDINTGQEA
jgi:hypothetical protein